MQNEIWWGALQYRIEAYECHARRTGLVWLFSGRHDPETDMAISAIHDHVMLLPPYPGGDTNAWLADIGVPWRQNEKSAFYIALCSGART